MNIKELTNSSKSFNNMDIGEFINSLKDKFTYQPFSERILHEIEAYIYEYVKYLEDTKIITDEKFAKSLNKFLFDALVIS